MSYFEHHRDDSWRDSYDAWKLATPPEYDGPDEEEEGEDEEDFYLYALNEEMDWQNRMERIA